MNTKILSQKSSLIFLTIAAFLLCRPVLAEDTVQNQIKIADEKLSSATLQIHEDNLSLTFEEALQEQREVVKHNDVSVSDAKLKQDAEVRFQQKRRGNLWFLEYDAKLHYVLTSCINTGMDSPVAKSLPDSIECYNGKDSYFLYPQGKGIDVFAKKNRSFPEATPVWNPMAPFPNFTMGRGLSHLSHIQIVKQGNAVELSGTVDSDMSVQATLDPAHGLVAKKITVFRRGCRDTWDIDGFLQTPSGVWIAKSSLWSRWHTNGKLLTHTRYTLAVPKSVPGSEYRNPNKLSKTWSLTDSRLSVSYSYSAGTWTPDFDALLVQTRAQEALQKQFKAERKHADEVALLFLAGFSIVSIFAIIYAVQRFYQRL